MVFWGFLLRGFFYFEAEFQLYASVAQRAEYEALTASGGSPLSSRRRPSYGLFFGVAEACRGHAGGFTEYFAEIT